MTCTLGTVPFALYVAFDFILLVMLRDRLLTLFQVRNVALKEVSMYYSMIMPTNGFSSGLITP
jgi:hypothetical protein